LERLTRKGGAFFDDDLFAFLQIRGQLTAIEQFVNTLITLLLKDTNLILKIAAKVFFLHALNIEAALVLVLSLTGEDLNVNDSSVDSRRAGKRRVFYVAGLFTKDR